MSLTDRIRCSTCNQPHPRLRHGERRVDDPVIRPILERRSGTDRREPRWVGRMRAGQLQGKDLTGRAA